MPAVTPISSAHQIRRDLAVAGMNRGHALMQAGNLASALNAYAEAVTLLRALPVSENPSWANSLGAALLNRGQLLHRLHGTARAAEALHAFDEAAVLLRALPLAEHSWARRNLAGTQLNRASLLLDLGEFAPGHTAAREALFLSAPAEKSELVEANLALKARRAACDALGHLLVSPGADQTALAGEASDLVDDALALIRHWARIGPTPFRPLAVRFFRYGTRLYRLHQPHFLAEFLLENLNPGFPEFRAIAGEEIALALRDQPGQPYLIMHDPATERRRQIWCELETIRLHLGSVAVTA